MGLSRKLGGGLSSRGTETPSHVEYTWSTQSYTIRDILTKFRLPCVVRCSGDAGSVLWEDFRFDMRQPLLLHAARTVRKMHARSLQMVEPSGELKEFGPPMAIPEDYDGWFFPLERHADPTLLPRHTRVQGVVGSHPSRFLVTAPLPAFTPRKDGSPGVKGQGPGSSEVKHVPHEVTAGEVLTKVEVVRGVPSVVPHSSLSPSSPSALGKGAKQSLRCVDENNHEVTLPFNHRALLFDVADNYGPHTTLTTPTPQNSDDIRTLHPSSPGVVHTQTIIAVGNSYLPRMFRHVFGELPALTQTFTSLLRCYSIFTEETVMAATVNEGVYFEADSACLELATDSSVRFKIALNAESELAKTYEYAQALRTCEEQAASFVRAIKTSFTVQPVGDVSGTEGGAGERERFKERSDQVDSSVAEGVSNVLKNVQTSGVRSESPQMDVRVYENETGIGDTSGPSMDLETDHVGDEKTKTDDAENVMTGDDNVADTASLSDGGTDVMYSESVSDVGDAIEANCEFDFTPGQLKRAKSFTGSMSTLTESSKTSSSSSSSSSLSTATDSDSDDSVLVTAQESCDVTPSQNSTLNRDSNSEDSAAMLRNSAPSPVYANVPKKLSVYREGQGVSCETEAADVAKTAPSDFLSVDSVSVDNSVRSVWNITPTNETHQESGTAMSDDDPTSLTNNTVPTGGAAIWWGEEDTENCNEEEGDINNIVSENMARSNSEPNRDYGSRQKKDLFSNSSMERTSLKIHSEKDHHRQLSPKSSVESATTNNVYSAAVTFSPSSSQMLVRSGGSSVQDLVIQRLERALDDATNFLNTHGNTPQPQKQQTHLTTALPEAPPRRWRSGSLNQPEDDDIQDGNGRYHHAQAPLSSNVHRGLNPSRKPGSVISSRPPLFSASASSFSLSDHPYRTRDNKLMNRRNQKTGVFQDVLSQNRVHHQSDTQLYSHQTHASQEQVDMDFVKMLGDRLLAVSRKSSFPKYQRLQSSEIEVGVCHESVDEGHDPLQKRKPKGEGHVRQDGGMYFGEGRDNVDVDSVDDAYNSEHWEMGDPTQTELTLTDLDLLDEEVV